MNISRPEISALGRIAKFVVCGMLAYWGLYVIVAPITNIDSHVYNLARLHLASRGGLFGNVLFTSMYQIMWPWSFDAVHLPFLAIGWGYALPSFLCFGGTCFVVHVMVRSRFGPDAGWVAILALLGLTCLVYQATSTKNDIPIVFSGAVWAYARWRWQREAKNHHLIWMVLAIGFMAGAKTTGALYGALLACWMLWDQRKNRKLMLQVAGGVAGAGVLLGSVETYIESARLYKNPLGPSELIHSVQNSDGFRGGVANLTRHIAGSIYVGPTFVGDPPRAAETIANAEKSLLAWAGLTDAGRGLHTLDSSLFFVQTGFEELSGFGPIGTIAMATMLAACFRWRPRTTWWKLSAIAFAGLLIISFTVAYSDWGNRFLIGLYALATVASVCALWEQETSYSLFFRWFFAGIALMSAIAAPLLSFNRGPSAIIASLRDRERFETCNYPLIGELRAKLRVLRTVNADSHIYYVVGDGSLVFPILEDPKLDAIVVTPARFLSLLLDGRVFPGDILVNDGGANPTLAAITTPIETISAPDVFSKTAVHQQVIYRFCLPKRQSPPD